MFMQIVKESEEFTLSSLSSSWENLDEYIKPIQYLQKRGARAEEGTILLRTQARHSAFLSMSSSAVELGNNSYLG